MPVFYAWIFSSEVECWTCNLKVPSSNPVGIFLKFFLWFFMTNIGIFHTLIHRKRHKWSLLYYSKVCNDCSFSFNSKMTFSVSLLDVVEMKNWEYVLNAQEKGITEMPTDVLEHFFSGLFLWMFDVIYSTFTLKITFLSRMSFNFCEISDLCWKFRSSFIAPFEISGALLLGLTRFWSTV